MFDLSKEKIEFHCENCNRKHTATLKDVMNRKTVHCFCGTHIQLKDSNGSVTQGVKSINSSMKKLEDAFKTLGRLR